MKFGLLGRNFLYLARKEPQLLKVMGTKAANDTNLFVLRVWASGVARSLYSDSRIGQRYVPYIECQQPAYANDIAHCHGWKCRAAF
ncbi:MAG TPA: hypothetical protein VNQ74_11570 [Burkholderiaceae bacterium]|nr:hypothetical protein [Burkholderiaceae bacterium]